MTAITQLILMILVLFVGWQLYRFIKHNPHMFVKGHMSKKIYKLALLILILVGFTILWVLLLK